MIFRADAENNITMILFRNAPFFTKSPGFFTPDKTSLYNQRRGRA
jgi:hypothetical protein